jgi:sugar (pentulose or hexulose) kinase
MIEGVIYALRDGLARIEKQGKTKVECLRVSGGGSQSDEVLQITADVFNLPVERPHTFETSGLGAAMAVAVGLGVYKSFDEAVSAMLRIDKRVEPNPQSVEIYQALYAEVYHPLYRRLRPIYRALHRLMSR